MMQLSNSVFLSTLGWSCSDRGVWTHQITPGKFDEATAMVIMERAMRGYRDNIAKDWTPSPKDVDWQEKNVARISDRGLWAVPSAGAYGSEWEIYQIDKLAILVTGDPGHTLNKRIGMVFIAMGWQVAFEKQMED